MKGRSQCFTDLKEYLTELEYDGKIANSFNLVDTYPNQDVWNNLQRYAIDKWKATVGFTELPRQLVFKGKGVLFKYALVFIQEMDKSKIDLAPAIDAGAEVQRVYNSLGHAVNDIARYLRVNFKIKCQSNHPLGGLVNTNPLAGKAGLGWQGHDGLLITPEYGQRNRIAPIFIESKIFEYTDNDEHKWIEKFCASCKKCMKKCPVKAIYEEKVPTIENIPGIGRTRTCIDRTKCFPQFMKTLGCSICIKTCPFSQGIDAYNKIKVAYNRSIEKRGQAVLK